MKQITVIRCSALSRPMTCAGSLFFDDLPEQDTNEAAKEGTAAGEYLELLLTKSGTVMLPTHAKNGVEFSDDMKFFTTPIAAEIALDHVDKVLCEQSIDWQTRSGIWIKGQYDASFVRDGKLYIDDLKYGWNIVDVRENWQLLGYAIGEVLRRGQAFDRIVMRIHQPRPHHEDGPTRAWEITYEQLLEYKEVIEARMDQIARGFRELVTSAKCKYCPAAAAHCTAFNRALHHGIDVVMSEFKQDSLNEKDIAFQLDLMDRVSEIFKIKNDSLKQLAVNRLGQGAIIPNYTIEDSYGDRKWKKEISPLVIETLTGKNIIEQKMMSPAQAEKIGVPKELVKNFVDRHFIGKKLVKKDLTKLADKIFGGGNK